MRDGHRLRERIQLSLDDRQVAALAVGALLLLAGMFALGLLVGLQVARRSPQPAPMNDLAALDEQRAPEGKSRTPPAQSPHPPVAAASPQSSAPATRVDPAPRKEMPAPPATVDVAPPRTVAVAPAEPATSLPAPPSRLGNYTVQLGASQTRAEALQLAARAGAAGLKPYVVEAHLPGKGVWYRIRVGAFGDKAAANRYRRDVEREMRISAVVMPAH